MKNLLLITIFLTLLFVNCTDKESNYKYIEYDTIDSFNQDDKYSTIVIDNMTIVVENKSVSIVNTDGIIKLYKLHAKIKDVHMYASVFGEYKEWIVVESNEEIGLFTTLTEYKIDN